MNQNTPAPERILAVRLTRESAQTLLSTICRSIFKKEPEFPEGILEVSIAYCKDFKLPPGTYRLHLRREEE